jgi:uroporphyrinogen decarboxylase
LRQHHSFWDICSDPALAAEATLQPVRRLELDAAILFSDILALPAALGWSVSFTDHPCLSAPDGGWESVLQARPATIRKRLGYTAEALRLARREIKTDLALLGFAGAPFTLACYLITGGSLDNQPMREIMRNRPREFHRLLLKLAELSAEHLELQIQASADAVQLFDSRAGMLTPSEFRQFALPAASAVCQRLGQQKIPVIYYLYGSRWLLTHQAACQAQVLGLDEMADLAQARNHFGPNAVLQGNLDPRVLFSETGTIQREVFRMLDATHGRGHIVNLGRGVLPDTPLSGIEAFIHAVHMWPKIQGHV